jgi:Galactose oxidase, central domain/Kelch motif
MEPTGTSSTTIPIKVNRLLTILIVFIPFFISLLSCQKEFLCGNCGDAPNIPPVAKAGNDTIVVLPADSAILRGNSSFDPDGSIVAFKWSQLSGPEKSAIRDSTAAITRVGSLRKGIYSFMLIVSDNGGLTHRDTMEVKVTDINLPPVANAGPDRVVFLPKDTLLLDGSGSTDPENNITTYKWRKINGAPITYIYFNDRIKTGAYSVIEDTYAFELTVTDAMGLFSIDTIVIKVTPPDAITAVLQDAGKEIKPRYYPTGITIGDKVIFAGGFEETGYSTRVDIFDTKTNTSTTAELSIPRMHMAAVAVNDKVYFAGGVTTNDKLTSRIDIYDVKKNTWTTDELSEARFFVAAEFINNKIFFAGGSTDANRAACSKTVDIFDINSNSWSTAKLAEAGFALSAVSTGTELFFAGGDYDCRHKVIEVYTAATDSWSTMLLTEPRAYLSSAYFDDYAFWGGGFQLDQKPSAALQILNVITNNVSFQKLTSPVTGFKSKALIHKNNILFFSGDGVNRIHFNKYEPGNAKSTEGRLDKDILAADIVSLKNRIYIGGGTVNGVISNKIWIMELP